MHYSYYLKCSRPVIHPAVKTTVTDVTPVEAVVEQSSIVADVVKKYLIADGIKTDTVPTETAEVKPEPASEPDPEPDVEETSQEEPVQEEFPEFNPNSPTEQMAQVIQNASNIKVARANKKLDVLVDALDQYEIDPPTQLDEDQVNDIMQYMSDIEVKYFKDIPMMENLDKEFIWNIPPYIYEDMCKACNQNLPDVLNPMFPFYIYLTPRPAEAMGTFVKIIIDLALDPEARSMRDKMHDDWIAKLNAEDAENEAEAANQLNADDED